MTIVPILEMWKLRPGGVTSLPQVTQLVHSETSTPAVSLPSLQPLPHPAREVTSPLLASVSPSIKWESKCPCWDTTR